MSSGSWPICSLDDIPDPGCYEFEIQNGDVAINGFVLHWQGQWYAYRNSCPHTGVTLNWLPNQFLDAGREFIQCSLHGALFQPDNGLCIYGPCVGRSLTRLPVVLQNGLLAIDRAAVTAAD